MRYPKFLLFIFILCCCAAGSFAQMTADPTAWKYEVKKKSANEYQLIVHLDLKTGWHIWSMKPGGDGYQIAPSFTFENNPKVKLKGAVREKGQATTTAMEGIDGKVTYLNGQVDYVQDVTVTGGNTRLKVTHGYQVCNDRMCLPPKDKEYVFEIK